MQHQIYKHNTLQDPILGRKVVERRIEFFDLFLAVLVFILAAVLLSACAPQAQAPVSTPTSASTPTIASTATAASTPTTPAASTPRLRITNNRDTPIHKLVVIFPEDRVEFGDIGPNETTEYMPVPHGVYSYAAYELEIDGQPYMQPVIDWVGESPVPGQDFTWIIDVEPNRQDMLTVQLVKATIDK